MQIKKTLTKKLLPLIFQNSEQRVGKRLESHCSVFLPLNSTGTVTPTSSPPVLEEIQKSGGGVEFNGK